MNTRPDPGEAVEAAPVRIPDSLELKSKPSKGWRSNAVYFTSPALIDRVFKHQTDWPHHIELKAWEHGRRVELRPIVPVVTNEETNRKKRLPYCMVLCRELRRPNASTWMLTQCHDVRWETRPMSFQDSSWWLSPQTLSSYHHLNEVSDFLDEALWGIPTGRSWVERDLKGALKTLLTPYGMVAEKLRIACRYGHQNGDLKRCIEKDHLTEPLGRVWLTFGKDIDNDPWRLCDLSEGYEHAERRIARHESFLRRFSGFAFASVSRICDHTERVIIALCAECWMHFDGYGHLVNSMLDHKAEGRRLSGDALPASHKVAPYTEVGACGSTAEDEWVLISDPPPMDGSEVCGVCSHEITLEYPGGLAAVGTRVMIHDECWTRMDPSRLQVSKIGCERSLSGVPECPGVPRHRVGQP